MVTRCPRAARSTLNACGVEPHPIGVCNEEGSGSATDSAHSCSGRVVKVVKGRSWARLTRALIRVALGDIESVETLNLFIALEHVRERGVEVEINELADEDLANQAVVSGQSDVGLGAPYGLIEGSSAPLRIFCQLQTLRYFPVVDKAAYPDWQALDGETFTVHSRGSSTEALARLVEQDEGIEFGEISYVSSSEVRANALLRGNIQTPPCSTSRTRTT